MRMRFLFLLFGALVVSTGCSSGVGQGQTRAVGGLAGSATDIEAAPHLAYISPPATLVSYPAPPPMGYAASSMAYTTSATVAYPARSPEVYEAQRAPVCLPVIPPPSAAAG